LAGNLKINFGNFPNFFDRQQLECAENKMSVIVEYQNQLHNRINPRNLRRYVDSFLK
jgi:hypothetical protein